MGLTRKQKLTLVVIVFGTFVTILNQTLVTPALPSIMEEMNITAATGQWLTTGFTLVNAIMIPITAYLQDRFSTRKLFLFSMIVFACGTLACAWGPDFNVLLGGRLLQAAGAGILMPLSMTVLLVMFPVDRRGSAMGIFGLVIAFAPAIGPTLAGIMIDQADWHIMFYVVTGLAVLVIIASAFLIDNHPPSNKGDSALDPLSITLSTIGLGSLLFSFSVFGTNGFDAFTIGTFVVGVIGVGWFFYRQLHLKTPMLRVRVLWNKKFLIATIIGMLVQGSLLAGGILMPIYVQTLLGFPATVSGLVLMPGAIIMGILNPLAGRWFDKYGARILGIVGMFLLLVSTVAFGMLSLESSIIYITIVFTIRMAAMALVNMPITTWGMNSLDTKLMNHGTSVNNTLRQVAGSMGTAVVISVSSIVTNYRFAEVGDMQANMEGINAAFLVCALFIFIGLILTVIFVKGKPGEALVATGPEELIVNDQAAINNRLLLEHIMKHDVYTLPPDATVKDAMEMFISKKISACPIVNVDGKPVGFISDGDILKMLSRQTESFIDPIALIATSASESTPYDEKLAQIIDLPVTKVGVRDLIGVSVNSDIQEVCRVLAKNHLKKVPVLEHGKIVGVINRSDITHYSMEAYLAAE